MIKVSLDGIKAAIFDLDGTIVNNQEFHKRAWIAALKKQGLLIDDKFYRTRISGGTNYSIIKAIFPEISDEDNQKLAEEKEKIYHKIYGKRVKEVPGLTKLIIDLKKRGLRLGLATTAPFYNQKFILQALNLENVFDAIVGDENVANTKPNPEVYLKTISILGVKPEECIAFEDSPAGIGAAKNARVKTVVGVLTYHLAEDIKSADFLIKDFTEVELD